MVILAAADIHGRHEVFAWLADVSRARGPAALVLAGDLFGYPEDDDETVEAAQERDRERALAVLDRLPQPVLYVMGNGDFVELRGAPPRQRSLHGRRVDLGGHNFVGYQCSLPFMGNVNERPAEVIAADLEALAPLAHMHGHSHSGFGRCGLHFNVAAGTATRAMLIDLATLKHEVVEAGGGGAAAADESQPEGGHP